jgi:hypothetical protein
MITAVVVTCLVGGTAERIVDRIVDKTGQTAKEIALLSKV